MTEKYKPKSGFVYCFKDRGLHTMIQSPSSYSIFDSLEYAEITCQQKFLKGTEYMIVKISGNTAKPVTGWRVVK